MLNIIEPRAIVELDLADSNQGNKLQPTSSVSKNVTIELRIGVYSLIVLNVLLIMVWFLK